MINCYSCCIYANNQANLLKLDLFCKQITFNLAIFGRNESGYRQKKMFQEHTFVDIRF